MSSHWRTRLLVAISLTSPQNCAVRVAYGNWRQGRGSCPLLANRWWRRWFLTTDIETGIGQSRSGRGRQFSRIGLRPFADRRRCAGRCRTTSKRRPRVDRRRRAHVRATQVNMAKTFGSHVAFIYPCHSTSARSAGLCHPIYDARHVRAFHHCRAADSIPDLGRRALGGGFCKSAAVSILPRRA